MFPISKVLIHSFEGLCYQLQQDWFESILVLESERFIQFIDNQLGLKAVAEQIQGYITEGKAMEIVLLRLLEYSPIIINGQKEFLEAIGQWDKLSHYDQLKYKGNQFYKMKQFIKAINYYKEAIAITYTVEVENNIGMMYLLLHDYRHAESRLLHALEIRPSSEIYHNLIQVYKQQGRLDEALELIYNLIEEYQSGLLLYEGGEICLQKRQFNEALLYFSKSYSLEPSVKARYKLIETRIEAKQLKSAMTEVEKIKVYDLVKYYLLKESIYEKAKHYDVAIETIEEAIEKCGEHIAFYMSLARLYRYENQIIKAIESVTKASKMINNGTTSQSSSNDKAFSHLAVNHEAVGHQAVGHEDELLYEMALIAKQAGQYQDYYNKINQLINAWKKEARYRLTY